MLCPLIEKIIREYKYANGIIPLLKFAIIIKFYV